MGKMNETTSKRQGVSGILDIIDNAIARLEEVIMAIGVILMAVNLMVGHRRVRATPSSITI